MKLSTTQSNILDCLKLLMAFLVVGIHVGKVAEYQYPNLVEFFTRIAVPFFFGVSGFLSYNSAISGDLIKSVYKYLRIYCVWVIVYMPFAAVYYMKNDITSYYAFTHYLR